MLCLFLLQLLFVTMFLVSVSVATVVCIVVVCGLLLLRLGFCCGMRRSDEVACVVTSVGSVVACVVKTSS